MDEQQTCTELDTEELNREVNMASCCFQISFHKIISKMPHSVNCVFATVSSSALKSKDSLVLKRVKDEL